MQKKKGTFNPHKSEIALTLDIHTKYKKKILSHRKQEAESNSNQCQFFQSNQCCLSSPQAANFVLPTTLNKGAIVGLGQPMLVIHVKDRLIPIFWETTWWDLVNNCCLTCCVPFIQVFEKSNFPPVDCKPGRSPCESKPQLTPQKVQVSLLKIPVPPGTSFHQRHKVADLSTNSHYSAMPHWHSGRHRSQEESKGQ